MESLFILLNQVYPLPDQLTSHLKKILKLKTFKPGQHLLKAGHICENVYFINDGLLRSYYIDKKGTEINKWFMRQGDVMYAIKSFLEQIPSIEYIQALDETSVYYITYRELQNVYAEYITFNVNGRILTESYYKLSEERETILRMTEAIDRYNYFLENFSDLTNMVPDKHLASYLRMTPVSLSRLRNNMTTKGKRNHGN